MGPRAVDLLGRVGVVAGVAVAVGLLAVRLLAPVQARPDGTRILDFAYHANISRAFWAGEAGNPYSAGALLRAFSAVSGREMGQAMPIGVCPSAFLLWWPVAKLANHDLAVAHAAWVGVSAGALFAALWLLVRDGRGKFPPLAAGLTAACLLSMTAGLTLIGGQITLVAIAVLVALWRPASRTTPDSWTDAAAVAGLLLVLAIKPTYLFPAGVALLAQRRWWVGLVGGAVVLSANVLALTLMDAGTAAEFLASLRMYSSGKVPAHFADAFVPTVMTSFTSAFIPALGQPTAFKLAETLSILGTLTVAGVALGGWASARLAFTAAVGVLLLLTPYLGPYEDLLLLAVIGVLVRDGVEWPPLASGWGLLVPVTWLFFNRLWVLDALPLWTHWGLKAALVASLLRLSLRPASAGYSVR